jgi:bacteriocin-like protein
MNKQNKFEAIDVTLTDEELKTVVGGVISGPIINPFIPFIGDECNYYEGGAHLRETKCCHCEKA